MNAFLPFLLGLAAGNTGCQDIENALQAAYKGESYNSEFVNTYQRVVTLKDHVTDPNLPDFECAAPINISGSGVKLIGDGDVLIKLKDHANAPVLVIGPTKSYSDQDYAALTPAARDAFRVKEVQVENLRLDGNRLNQDHECWDFENCDDAAHPLSAIRNNGVTVRYSEDITLLNLKVKANRSGGFVAERFSNNILVDGYQSDDNFFDGFTAYETSNSVFKNLSLNRNLAAGISLDLNVTGNTFMNVAINHTGDVGIFARAVHDNLFSNFVIDTPHSHGIFLARWPEHAPDVDGQVPWDTATSNIFEDLKVINSEQGVAIRVNDAECVGNRLTRYHFENNAGGDISLAKDGILEIDPQENNAAGFL